MKDDQERCERALIRRLDRGLVTRSASLVRRGLDDLAKQQPRITSSDVLPSISDQSQQAADFEIPQDPDTQKLLDYLIVHGWDVYHQLGKVQFDDWAEEIRARFRDFRDEIEPHLRKIFALEADSAREADYGEHIRDLTIIGMSKYLELLGEINKVDFHVWERRMLSDSDTVKRSLEEMNSNEKQGLYFRSKVLYAGYQSIFENGEQRFEEWSSYLLARLNQDEKRKVEPHLHSIYNTILWIAETSGLEDLSKYYRMLD